MPADGEWNIYRLRQPEHDEMMKNDFEELDVKHLFVPFSASPSAGAMVIATHPEFHLSNEEITKNYAYAISLENPGYEKIFHADRYGGEGISFHGGGARCGYDGRYQIKGIGPNPLVGANADPRHSDGQLSVKSALSEYIWSLALQDILPFGVVRCLAVIGIGLPRPTTTSPASGRTRALILREPALRLAHFERAHYFRPKTDIERHRKEDVGRVREMITRLPNLLTPPPDLTCSEWNTLDGKEKLELGIYELTRRAAIQAAYARSTLLLHNTSPSNIALDGRWLDLTSTASLHPDQGYGHENFDIAWSALKYQAAPILRGILSICIGAGEYFFDEKYSTTLLSNASRRFEIEYLYANSRYLLSFAGIPAFIAEKIYRDELCLTWAMQLSEHMFGALTSHKINAKYLRKSSLKIGSPDLNLLHYTFARKLEAPWTHQNNIGIDISSKLDEMFSKILELSIFISKSIGVKKESLFFSIAANSIRYASRKNELDFDSINSKLQTISMELESDKPSFIDSISRYQIKLKNEIAHFFSYDPGTTLSIANTRNSKILHYDFVKNTLTGKNSANETEFHDAINIKNCIDAIFFEKLGIF